ncbi:hypothetical protein B9Z55_004094 [Caenorhabditis nigoni]|uniref:Uncharacterized protein n=1 Tax=Caenorhabditis nigoni TaxID=1611254 RepID=A0A2G5UUT7_9PELO|nr:hypothetical protein B9Z55_004094 [Caenorhabditis nigoni]
MSGSLEEEMVDQKEEEDAEKGQKRRSERKKSVEADLQYGGFIFFEQVHNQFALCWSADGERAEKAEWACGRSIVLQSAKMVKQLQEFKSEKAREVEESEKEHGVVVCALFRELFQTMVVGGWINGSAKYQKSTVLEFVEWQSGEERRKLSRRVAGCVGCRM